MFTIAAAIMLTLIVIVLKRSKVSAEKKTEKSLADFDTYAFLPESTINWPTLGRESETDVSVMVVNTVNQNMQAIGYQIDLDCPDLLVVLKTGKVFSNRPVYASFPYSKTLPVHPVYLAYTYKGYQMFNEIVDFDDFENDKIWLRIDVVERKTKEVLWTASSNEAVYVKNSPQEIIDYINEMFKEYPTIEATHE
jgi:hypothetical protein